MSDLDSVQVKRQQAAARQRRRRVRRVEYFPDAQARAILDSLKGPYSPWNSVSLTLNIIVREWQAQRCAAQPEVRRGA